MKRSLSAPCVEWAERLAAVHPDDLSPSDRAALDDPRREARTSAQAYVPVGASSLAEVLQVGGDD